MENYACQAKILRGMRIAARLGLQFSKETETAMQDLSSSVLTLHKVYEIYSFLVQDWKLPIPL